MAGDNSGDDQLLGDSDHEDVTMQEDVVDYSNVTLYPQGDANDRTDEDTGNETDPQGHMSSLPRILLRGNVEIEDRRRRDN